MKLSALIVTFLVSGYCLAGNGSGVQKVVVTDEAYIQELQEAIRQQHPVCIEGEQFIPSKLEGTLYRFRLEAKKLYRDEFSTINIRVIQD